MPVNSQNSAVVTGLEKVSSHSNPKEKLCQRMFKLPHCCCCVTSVMSDSLRPHRRQPTRLCHPWDSPGKSTGVLLQFFSIAFSETTAQFLRESVPTRPLSFLPREKTSLCSAGGRPSSYILDFMSHLFKDLVPIEIYLPLCNIHFSSSILFCIEKYRVAFL